MLKPFSVTHYLASHKMRIFSLAVTITLAFSTICVLHIFLGTLQQFYRQNFLSPNSVFSSVYQQYGQPIAAPPNVQGVAPVPAKEDVFLVYSVLGKVNARIWNVPPSDLPLMLQTAGMEISEGVLPSVPGEAAIPEQWAVNQNVRVGDIIDLSFGATPDVRIVGLLKAPDIQCGIGVIPQVEASRYLYPGVQIGEQDFEKSWSAEPNVLIENFESRAALHKQLYELTFLFGGLLLSAIIVAIAVLCSSTVISTHLAMRKTEFSLLGALGWTRPMFNRYFLSEVTAYYSISIIFGIALVAVIGGMLDRVMFAPQGLELVWFTPVGLATLLFGILFSFVCILIKGRNIILQSVNSQNLI